MNKKLIILLTLPIIILLGISAYWASVSSLGYEIKLPIRGYDPRDLLSGHYILYSIDWDKADCTQFTDGICHQSDFCQEGACKFYIPETDAKQLDRLLFVSNSDFAIIYRYEQNRLPLALKLLIDNQPWQEFIKQ